MSESRSSASSNTEFLNPNEWELVDLSHALEDDRRWAPWWARTRVNYQSHEVGARVLRWLFGVPTRLLENGLGWANENLMLSSHGTTHVDAPWHYSPTCQGQPSRSIDEMPLDWFFGPGVVLDLREHAKTREAICTADLDQALQQIGHTLSAGEILLLWTGSDALWGTRDYFECGPSVTAEATEYLISNGVRLMGIDAWGWDGPIARQARQAREENRRGVFWAAHYVGVRIEYCHIERLTNLGQIPATGSWVCAFPLKVKRGSAGPARVVAFVPRSGM